MLRPFYRLFDEAGDAGSGGGGEGTILSGAKGGSGDAGGGAGGGSGAGGGGGGGGSANQNWRSNLFGPDGTINQTNFEALPDRLKPFKATFQKYKTDEDLLFALGHSESLVGKKGLMPLPEGASEADKKEFDARLRDVLRVPKEAKGYGLKKPDSLPAELWNEEYVSGIQEVAHKFGVSPEALRALAEFDGNYAIGLKTKNDGATAAQAKAEREEFFKELGTDADASLLKAKRLAITLGLDVNDPRIGNDIRTLRILTKAAGMIGEHALVTSDSQPGGESPSEKIASIMNDEGNPMYRAYRDPAHPQHQQANDLVLKLTEQESQLARRGR